MNKQVLYALTSHFLMPTEKNRCLNSYLCSSSNKSQTASLRAEWSRRGAKNYFPCRTSGWLSERSRHPMRGGSNIIISSTSIQVCFGQV